MLYEFKTVKPVGPLTFLVLCKVCDLMVLVMQNLYGLVDWVIARILLAWTEVILITQFNCCAVFVYNFPVSVLFYTKIEVIRLSLAVVCSVYAKTKVTFAISDLSMLILFFKQILIADSSPVGSRFRTQPPSAQKKIVEVSFCLNSLG